MIMRNRPRSGGAFCGMMHWACWQLAGVFGTGQVRRPSRGGRQAHPPRSVGCPVLTQCGPLPLGRHSVVSDEIPVHFALPNPAASLICWLPRNRQRRRERQFASRTPQYAGALRGRVRRGTREARPIVVCRKRQAPLVWNLSPASAGLFRAGWVGNASGQTHSEPAMRWLAVTGCGNGSIYRNYQACPKNIGVPFGRIGDAGIERGGRVRTCPFEQVHTGTGIMQIRGVT
jgi:hypothetical protein